MNATKQRKIYLDLLRIISILFVIYNHTSERGYFLYAFDSPFYLKVIYIATGALIAVAVPIFFMISGALLIPKEESIKDLYVKRILRIVVVLVVFSIVQYAYQIIFQDAEFSIRYFVVNTVTRNITPAYWYLYAYLAYLICLPLIRKMAKNMSNTEFKYLFIVFLIVEGVFTAIVYLLNIGEINDFFVIPFFNRVVIYPMLGYYMEYRVDEERYNSKGLIKWIIAMVLVLAFIVVMTLYRNLPYEEFTDYDKGLFTTGFTFILDVGVFYIVKLIFKGRKVPKVLELIITTIGSTVFGTYLIENIIRDNTIFVYDGLANVFGKFISAWIRCAFVVLVGAVIIYIIKLIPGVKKFL